ncbi:MAG: hypothetical protein INR70_43740 [Parafilimonas terrae]|nr:hypothetical protein [Parafilimonas terrae]
MGKPDTEITIADARWVWLKGFRREVLAELAGRRGATAMAAICANSDEVVYSQAWGADPVREKALAAWLDSFVMHRLTREALYPLGEGTSILLGVEGDGTLRVTTWSRWKRDCRAVTEAQWSHRWILDDLSRCPWQTHLGVGHGGVPIGLTAAERLMLKGRLSGACRDAWLGEHVPA